ncbi:methylthioribulose-1-phosphate dehydratase [Ceratobasidium sp. AG-Ba]|nr:methylthioribulose-1-phosphate dehydratase [Ceratobasidium sp. AG-Ba]
MLAQSQSSNSDTNEEAMGILLKAQATVAKNKKQKESQHLKDAKEELKELLEVGAQDYAALITELEELCQAFQMELAASHDREGKHWADVAAEQARFNSSVISLINKCQERDEMRERLQINALACAYSSLNQTKSIISKHMRS